jgi:predicted Zn-ribbon and HTH transcriptional regulator
VPGSPLDPRAEGTNGLIKQGATPVTEADDIISALRPIIGADFPAREDDAEEVEKSQAEPAADERARVIALLSPAPVSIDDLIRLSGTSPRIVRMVLLELEIAGRIERHGGGLVSLRPPTAPCEGCGSMCRVHCAGRSRQAPASKRQYIAPPDQALPRSLARPFRPLILRAARPHAEELSCRKQAHRQGFKSLRLSILRRYD